MSKFSGTIRPLVAADRAQWEPLWHGYQTFYERSVEPVVTETVFTRFLDPAEPMFALVAEQDGRVIGLAHCILHRATSFVGDLLYLNDLFVAPDIRGSGAGRALIDAIYAEADRIGAARVYWLTHESNATARRLYDQVATNYGFIQYRR